MRSQLLTSKLLKQGFTRNRLITTFKKFYGRHSVLVDRFKVSVTNIIIDLFLETLYHWWLSVPFYSQNFYRYWRLVTVPSYSQYYILPYYDYYINWIWLYHSVWQVSLVRQRTLTRPEHLVLPFLQCALLFERSTCYAFITDFGTSMDYSFD